MHLVLDLCEDDDIARLGRSNQFCVLAEARVILGEYDDTAARFSTSSSSFAGAQSPTELSRSAPEHTKPPLLLLGSLLPKSNQ